MGRIIRYHPSSQILRINTTVPLSSAAGCTVYTLSIVPHPRWPPTKFDCSNVDHNVNRYLERVLRYGFTRLVNRLLGRGCKFRSARISQSRPSIYFSHPLKLPLFSESDSRRLYPRGMATFAEKIITSPPFSLNRRLSREDRGSKIVGKGYIKGYPRRSTRTTICIFHFPRSESVVNNRLILPFLNHRSGNKNPAPRNFLREYIYICIYKVFPKVLWKQNHFLR